MFSFAFVSCIVVMTKTVGLNAYTAQPKEERFVKGFTRI
jgi:hypothetical protein